VQCRAWARVRASRTSADPSNTASCSPSTKKGAAWRCAARPARCVSSCSARRPRASSTPRARTVRDWSCSASGGSDVGEVLAAVLAQHLPHPRALCRAGGAIPGQELAVALDRRAGDRPAHCEALEQQLHRALPRVLLRPRPAGERPRVLLAGAERQRPAQPQNVAFGVAVVAARRLQPLALALAPTHLRAPAAPPR